MFESMTYLLQDFFLDKLICIETQIIHSNHDKTEWPIICVHTFEPFKNDLNIIKFLAAL